MFLSYWVEFMIVAARTLHSDAAECVECVGDHVIAIQVASDLAVNFGLRDFHMPNEVPRSRCDKAKSQNAVRFTGKKDVSSDLFLYEPSVWFVIVE